MGKKKDQALAHAYIEISPAFDEADAAIDAFAQKVQARVAKAVADGISDGIRKAIPATRGIGPITVTNNNPTLVADLIDRALKEHAPLRGL